MNKPVAWIDSVGNITKQNLGNFTPLYTQDQLEEARKLGMQQERALWNLAESTQEIMNTHPAKELSDAEIHQVYLDIEEMKCPSDDFEHMTFAKAILRKAQEK